MKKVSTFVWLLSLLLSSSPLWAGFAVKSAHTAPVSAASGMAAETAAAAGSQKFSLTQRLRLRQTEADRQLATHEPGLKAPAEKNRKLSRRSLIFSSIGLVMIFITIRGIPLLGVLIGLAGFFTGLSAIKKEGKNGIATLGIILGLIPLAFLLIGIVILAIEWS